MAVILTTDSEFEKQIAEHDKVVVKYFADWCGQCKLFSPKYKRLSNDERFKDVLFLDINAEENPTARQLANVNNLPFFATFTNGAYSGGDATSKEDKVVELIEKIL